MSIRITGEFLGGLSVKMTHQPSGATLITDPPVDNGGKGSSFSPTDLVATGLGACMMSIIALIGQRDNLDLKGMKVSVDKHMTSSTPRRISKLEVILTLPKHLLSESRAKLERGAKTCPVYHSLLSEIEVSTTIKYE